jgi:hypothetical protein
MTFEIRQAGLGRITGAPHSTKNQALLPALQVHAGRALAIPRPLAHRAP